MKTSGKVRTVIVMVALFSVSLILIYQWLPPGKLGLDKEYYRDLESDGNAIAKNLWTYYEKNNQYPESLNELHVTLKVSKVDKWYLSVGGQVFRLTTPTGWGGLFIGDSFRPNQIQWTMHMSK